MAASAWEEWSRLDDVTLHLIWPLVVPCKPWVSEDFPDIWDSQSMRTAAKLWGCHHRQKCDAQQRAWRHFLLYSLVVLDAGVPLSPKLGKCFLQSLKYQKTMHWRAGVWGNPDLPSSQRGYVPSFSLVCFPWRYKLRLQLGKCLLSVTLNNLSFKGSKYYIELGLQKSKSQTPFAKRSFHS